MRRDGREDPSCGVSRWSRTILPPGRTIPLLMMIITTGLLVGPAQATLPGGQQQHHQQQQQRQDTVVEMMSVELEASMQSFVMSEFQATLSAVAKAAAQESAAESVTEGPPHAGVRDSSAVVGQVFRMSFPPRLANGSCNIHVSMSHTHTPASTHRKQCDAVQSKNYSIVLCHRVKSWNVYDVCGSRYAIE